MAFEGEGSPPLVVIDANLLYPFHLRNLLVQLGVDAVIAPRWTARIHAEWISNLVAVGSVPKECLLLTLDLINKVLPAAEVHGWEARMNGLTLPDPDDRHVLAAALAAGASTILTMNLRDFPASTLATHGVAAVHPDDFLCELYDADPGLLRASMEAAQANLSRSMPSVAAYLDVLGRQGAAAIHAPYAQVNSHCQIVACAAVGRELTVRSGARHAEKRIYVAERRTAAFGSEQNLCPTDPKSA